MPRKPKQLKINDNQPMINEIKDNRVHFDRIDNTLAEKHYGYYLICSVSKSSQVKNSRTYISFKHKKEYYRYKAKQDNSIYKRTPVKNKTLILNNNKDYELLISDVIKRIFIEVKKLRLTESILEGLNYTISVFRSHKIKVNTLDEITIKYFRLVENSVVSTDNMVIKISASRFFNEVTKVNPSLGKQFFNFQIDNTKPYSNKRQNAALPSTVLYQLSFFAEKYFQEIMKKVKDFKEYSKMSFFSLENMLTTLMTEDRKGKSLFVRILLVKLKQELNIDASVLLYSENQILNMNKKDSVKAMNKRSELKKMSYSGVDILKKELNYSLTWFSELFPNYPYDKKVLSRYIGCTPSDIKTIKRTFVEYFDFPMKKLEEILFPSNHHIYSLYLCLLIELGVNQESLEFLEVIKDEDNKYKIKGDDVGLMVLIDVPKHRSNSNITIPIKNNSKLKKMIDFYVEWNTPLYNFSKSNQLLQYVGNGTKVLHQPVGVEKNFLTSYKLTSNNFFTRYEIIDTNNSRLDFIEHRAIRKSHLLQDFYKGKTEFERQMRKNHKSNETTKIYYENQNFEWMGVKKHKIAIAQNLVVGIFKGEVAREEHKTAKLILGPLADCKDNKKPSFHNAPSLKEEEYCTDWCKCLTQCDKSRVVPKIHGPVIYAWIDYMDKEKDKFFRIQDWEKEYLIDYQSACDTINYFENDEKDFCKNEFKKYSNFIQMRFQRVLKVKEN